MSAKLSRPLTLRPAMARRIVAELRRGNFMEAASASAGVLAKTARRWRMRGVRRMESGKKPRADLVAYLFPPRGPMPDVEAPSVGLDTMEGRLAWLSAFALACDLAEGEVECGGVASLQAAALSNPQVMLTFLARRFSARWAPRQVSEISGPAGGAVQVDGLAGFLAGGFSGPADGGGQKPGM